MMGSGRFTRLLFSPPPCGEGPGVGVAPDKAPSAKSLYAVTRSAILNHPHPYPPHKGEGPEASRSLMLQGDA